METGLRFKLENRYRLSLVFTVFYLNALQLHQPGTELAGI